MQPDVTPVRRALPIRLWSFSVVRYLIVGALSFLFDIGMLWVLHEALHIPLAISTPTAFLLSFAITFTLQRTLAFRAQDSVAPSVIRYGLLVAANTVATTAIVWATDAIGLPWAVGKVVAVVATTVWNYFAYRHWVFSPREVKD